MGSSDWKLGMSKSTTFKTLNATILLTGYFSFRNILLNAGSLKNSEWGAELWIKLPCRYTTWNLTFALTHGMKHSIECPKKHWFLIFLCCCSSLKYHTVVSLSKRKPQEKIRKRKKSQNQNMTSLQFKSCRGLKYVFLPLCGIIDGSVWIEIVGSYCFLSENLQCVL